MVWRGVRSKSKFVPDRNYSARVGSAYLWVLPTCTSLLTAIYLRSFGSLVVLIVLQVVMFVFILLSIIGGPRLLPSLETAWLAVRSIPLSLGLLRTLAPALFITVVLAIFSQDTWRIVGQLSVSKLLLVSGLLVSPAIVLGISSLIAQITSLIEKPMTSEEMILIVRQIREVAFSQQQELLSLEGWGMAQQELAWRHDFFLLQFARKKLGPRPIIGFSLVFLVVGLLIGLALWLYLVVILRTIVTTETLADWLQQPLPDLNQLVPILPFLALGRGLIVAIKVSFFLASLQVMIYGVSVLTDDGYKEQFANTMGHHIREWLAAIAVYYALTTPGYQILTVDERDRKRGIVRYSIVVQSPTTEAQARQACEHICAREANMNLVVITAYEQQAHPSDYHSGSNANRWQMTVNRRKNIHSVNRIDLSGVAQELRYQHNLGMEYSRQNTPIPDEWFGDHPIAIQIGKEIWANDHEHDTVLHPYISLGKNSAVILADVALTKRLPASSDYRNLVKSALASLHAQIPTTKLIYITVYFRDRLDEIAQLTINREANYADYKDEKSKRRSMNLNKWISS